jgi:DNA polymerase-3 subunit beta
VKIALACNQFADAVAWTARAVNPRPSVPTLGGILLETRERDGEDQLVLSAFDYDATCRTVIPVRIDEPGRALLPARLLAEVAKSLPTGPAEMTLSDTEATITYGTARSVLSTLPVEHFPTLPEPPAAIGTVDGGALKTVASQVLPIVNRGSALAALRCVQIEADGDALTLVGADTPRVGAGVISWQPADPDAQHTALVFADILAEVARAAGPWPITIGLGEGIASFEAAGRTTTVRLVEESFPKYRRFLDLDFPSWATADTGALLEAAKRVALFAEKNAPIHLDIAQGAITVHAGSEAGRGSETVAAELEGDDIEVAFHAPYLLDALTAVAVEHDTVRIAMNPASKPTQFTGAVDDPAFRCTVMALRV